MQKKIILVSRCAWTLYNFRAGLMQALRQRGHTVVAGGAAGDGVEPKIEALGVPFVPLPVDKKGVNPRADVALFWALYRWYRRERPDVVHHFTIKPVIYGSIAARLAGVPRIVNTITGLGYVFTEERVTWLRCLVEWQYRLALACAHFTFFQNPDDQKVFLAHHIVNPVKTGLLPGSGVDCQAFMPGPGLPLPSRKPLTFLMVARLLREKGVYEFVEAARMVKDDFPQINCFLLGRLDERNPTVISKKDLDLWHTKGVTNWLGEVTDVRPLIAQADVVVLPSYREHPRALLKRLPWKPSLRGRCGLSGVVEDGVNGPSYRYAMPKHWPRRAL
jgi:glycosyltransferase involved in cell wall biosynthesis